MSHKIKLNIILSIVIFLVSLGFIARYSILFGMCGEFDYSCADKLIFNFAHPIVLGLTPLIPILMLLQFFRKEIFLSWCKYAVPLIPFIIIVIINTPVYCQATLGLCLDKKGMTKFLADGFALLSIIVIIAKSFALRRVSK